MVRAFHAGAVKFAWSRMRMKVKVAVVYYNYNYCLTDLEMIGLVKLKLMWKVDRCCIGDLLLG